MSTAHEALPWLRDGAFVLPYNTAGLVTVAAILATVLITFVSTSLQSRSVRLFSSEDVEPPPAPYWLPFVGNTASFALDTRAYLGSLHKRFGPSIFRLNVGGEKIYYVPYGEAVLACFKNSRDFSAKALSMLGLSSQFGCPAADLKEIDKDNSGINTKPAAGYEDMDPRKRMWHIQHRDFHSLMSGPSLDAMTVQFVSVFSAQLKATSKIESATEWTVMPDFYLFLRNEMFRASLQALCGERFWEVNPNFSEEFWGFDGSMLDYIRRKPRWLAPKSYAKRDLAHGSVMKWHRDMAMSSDKARQETGAGWEPLRGAAIMRARQVMFKDLGLSAEAVAAMDLGMMWAANANMIPSTLWALLHIIVSPSLTARVRAETASCYDTASDSFDIAALCAKPLLTSIYMEALRFCVATSAARNIEPGRGTPRLGGFAMARDAMLLSISWFGAHDERFWNAGPTGAHTVDEFWAERFLAYPGDATSGPIRKPGGGSGSGGAEVERTVEDDRAATVVSAGIQGHFYPYGGGVRMCPGRFFAKQEMIAAIAVMLQRFEMEAVDPVAAKKTKPDVGYFPVGALSPDRKIAVRIRRRE